MGGSAGSVRVIADFLSALKDNFKIAIVVVVHRMNDPDSVLVELLSSRTTLMVKEAEEKEKITPGYVYIAPVDYHLLIDDDKTFSIDCSEKVNFSRPSIDSTLISAANVYGNQLITILLSGSNNDGMKGLIAVKKAGGMTVVQDPQTSEVSYMPQRAVDGADPDFIIESGKLADFIRKMLI